MLGTPGGAVSTRSAKAGRLERASARIIRSYGSFASFNDPDGNSWLLQEVTDEGCPAASISGATSFGFGERSGRARYVARKLPHREHEKRTGQRDDKMVHSGTLRISWRSRLAGSCRNEEIAHERRAVDNSRRPSQPTFRIPITQRLVWDSLLMQRVRKFCI